MLTHINHTTKLIKLTDYSNFIIMILVVYELIVSGQVRHFSNTYLFTI